MSSKYLLISKSTSFKQRGEMSNSNFCFYWNKQENIAGAVCVAYVISRCGILNGRTSDLPPLPAYQVNHTYSLSHFPRCSVSLSVSRTHKSTYIHCFTVSPLPLHGTVQTSYTSTTWQVGELLCQTEEPLQCRGPQWHTAFCWFIPVRPRCHSVPLFVPLSIITIPLSLLFVSVHSCCHCRNPDTLPCYLILTVNFLSFFCGEGFVPGLILYCSSRVLTRPPLMSSSSQRRASPLMCDFQC